MVRTFDLMITTSLLLIIICNEQSITVCLRQSSLTGRASQTPAKLLKKYLWPRRKPLRTRQNNEDSEFPSEVSNGENDFRTFTIITTRSARFDIVRSLEKSLRIRRQIITRAITEPSVASSVEPFGEDLIGLELEMIQKGNPEPGPDWATAIQAWGKAWDLHVYVFAILFILIAIASGFGLADDLIKNHGIKGLKLTLYLTFLLLGCSRGIMLFVDPYNSRGILDLYSSYVAWSLGIPCVLTALGLLLLVFGEAISMEITPPRFQKLSTALGIMACNVIVVVGTDIVFLLAEKFLALLIICQIYFVLFGIILTVGYYYIGCKLSCNSAASVYGDTSLIRLRMFVFAIAMLNVLFMGIQVYSAFDFVFHPGVPRAAWPWYAVQTSLRALETMGIIRDSRFKPRTVVSLVLQVWFQISNLRRVISQENQVLQHCNLSTKAAVLLPFNEHYRDKEALNGTLKVHMSNTEFVSGIDGEPGGAILFKGIQDSYVEIEADKQIDFGYSMTILSHILPSVSHTGPIVHYKSDQHGVQMWVQGTVAEKGQLSARFNRRNLSHSKWLKADVINVGQWNYIGASYDHVTGEASLYHDGVHVYSAFIGKNIYLATQYEIRIGAMLLSSLGKYKGKVACIQFYSKALQEQEVAAARRACIPVVPLQYLSLNLTSPLHVAEVNETKLIVKASANMNTTNPTFQFDWGDGTETCRRVSDTGDHMYRFIGNYTLHVQAWTMCNTSTLSAKANISVPTPVLVLRNVALQSNATVFGEATQFRLFVGRGSDFECLWSLGDHANVTAYISRANSSAFVRNHTYSVPADYKVLVTCRNRRSKLTASTIVLVQNRIKGLTVYPIPPILFGTEFKVRWRIDNGTGVTYKVTFSAIPLQVAATTEWDLYGQTSVTLQEYKTPGEFLVHVSASNAVTNWISAWTKCNIFRPVLPFTPIVLDSSRDLEVNQTITILITNVSSVSGTNVSYLVNFGDNSKAIVTHRSYVNYSYDLHGLYTVSITAMNEVSTFNTSITIKVHKPVLKLEGASIPFLVAKVHQSVHIPIFFLKGSDFHCHWEFGDGQEIKKNSTEELVYFKDLNDNLELFTNVSMSVKHVFKRVGVYQVIVNCQNRLSEMITIAYAMVQLEIQSFQVSTVSPVRFGDTFSINCTIDAGTNVSFKMYLNNQELDIKNQGFFSVAHVTPSIYKQAKKHNITVTATNLVTPLLSHTQVVTIEVPVSEVNISMNYFEGSRLHAGHGASMDIFPEGVPVVFNANVDKGSSLEYTWSISKATIYIEQNRLKIQHIFNARGIYIVSISVRNQVSEAVSIAVIAIQKRAKFLYRYLECSSPKVRNETVTIRATLEALGTNSTLLVELDNITRYWYGEADARNNLNAAANEINTQYQGNLGRTTTIHYVFETPGVYNITAILKNDVSRSSVTCKVEILPRPCKRPEVKLKHVGSSQIDARYLFKADNIIIEADVDIFCPESEETQYKWKIFEYNQEARSFVPFTDVDSYAEASMRELRLQKRALPLGLFRLSLSVNMIGEGLDDFFAVVEGYIKTKQSPLTAEISGGSEIRRTSGSTVSLDALGSHDPDIGPGDHSGMRFFWLCRNISERFPDLLEDFINGFNGTAEYPISNRSSRSSVSSEQGCYRNGEYVISNRSHLNLTTVLMATNETYKIVLVVRKDSRTSSTSQLLELSVEDIPELTIRCVVNCHKKVNPSEKLTVSSECSGNACNAKLTYSWSLLYMESDEDTNSTWKTNNSLMKSRHISPHGSFPIIVIKKNVLQGNRRYKLTVKGNLPSGSYGLASHVFEVNAPPRDGTCDVEPRVGHVLTTRYRLWCTGWHDPDGPLKYEIYHVRGKEESPLQYGGNAATIITLPLGDGDNYTINITVRISDRLGAASSVRLQLQSLPPLLKGAQLMNQLSDLILDTNQDMLRNAMSISSVLNHQAGKDTPELSKQRKKIRELLIFALVKETTPSKQAVQLLSASLQEATQVTSEVSYEAQEAVTSALDKMATVFESESLETDSNSLETTAAGMTGTIGNLLDVASENAAVHQPNSTIQTSSENVEEPADNETVPSKSEVLVNKLFNVVDSLSTSVLRTKVSYEEATEIISPRLALNLKSTSPSDTGGNVNTGFASFNVPKGKDLLRNARPGLTSVNQKVMYTPKNYHTYHNSSRDISTPVVSLSYEDKEKKELITVSNLKKYIEYFLPAPDVLPGPNTYSVNVKAQDTWAYHKLVVSSKDEAVSIEVTPFNCSHKLQLHVQENRHPTKDKFSWRKEIWLSATDVPSNTSYSACFKDYSDYTLFIPNARLKQSTYFVGVLYSNGKEDIRSSNETAVMKYSIRVYKSKCLYWNQRQLAWMGDGCFVGPFTSPKQIHCMTNHLTSFGSGMFVAPNPIDFRKALAGFADAFQSGNVVVMFTIITLLMLYLVLAIWAWRVDRKDAMQIGATILPPSRPNSHYLYEVYVVTGSRNGSGTTAHVGCEIFGEDDDSGPCYLLDANRPLFRRGDLNVFILSVPSSFGVIRGIRIWHDNGGYSPSWFLCRAMLRDCQTDEKWVFLAGPAGRWLDVAEEDGKIDILLKPASELDMVSFKKLFNTKIRKGICDNHLWFSVAYRPPRSPFTRLQRLSCCLSLLFSFMVTTAMFYGSGPLPGDTSSSVQFGPIKLNMRTVIIGIESALIAIPVNILIVAFFRNSKAKGDRIKENKCCHGENDSQASEQETETDSINSDMHNLTSRMEKNMDLDDIQCHIGGEDDFQYGIKADKTGSKRKESFASNEETESIDDESLQNPQNPGFLGKLRGKFQSLGGPCFPHWCVYVGWVLCILTVSLSSVFTLFYSMMWGKEQSNMWLTTMAISFIQDTLISQPLKVLIVALIFAVFFKSADDDDHFEESQSAAEVPDEEDIHQELTNEELAQYDPPPKKILKILRIKEIRRREIVKLFTDICLYVILLAMVMILSFQYRNPASYKMINTLRRVFVDPMHNSSRVRFEQVNGVSSVWDWTRQTLLPGLFPDQIYKGLLSEPYMADRMSLQLGVARLRQVRIRKGTCTVNRWFNETFPQCNGFYSMLKEDTKSYESHWENATVKPKNNNKRNLFSFSSGMSDHSQTSWQHMDNFAAHHALPVIGKFATYSGGGYVIILNQSTDTSQEQMHWLDSRSRALHAEFVAYNPSINMVGAVTITFELPPLGGVFKSFEVFTVSMYGSLRKHPAARIIGEVIAAVVLIFMIYRVVLAIFHDKCQYFRDASKILDLVFVLTGMVIVFLKVLKEGFKMRATDQFKEDPKQFLDFHQCGFYDELTDYAFALLNFIAIVRFSFFLKFLGCLEHILSTIANCFYELFACLVVFFCLMMAFTSLFSIAFRGESDDFKDFSSSLQTSISYMARMVRSKEAMTSHTVVRAVALFSCCVTLIFFYLTVIRSVFIVGYRKTLTEDRGKEKEKSFESGIFEVFKDKFRELAGIEKEKEVIVQEEEDIHEVRLNALINYFNKSQFFRLRLLLNEVYTDDFAEDLSLFDVVPLKQKPRHYIREDTGVQEDHRLKKGETFKPSTEIKQDPISENMQNKSERKSHVTFDLPVEDDRATTRNPTFNEEGELGGDTVPRDNNSEMPNEIEKLNVLEKLVEEKIRGLQKRQEDSTLPSGSGSVEKEIQMLLRLQQRIDEARITGPPSTQPSQEKLTKD